MLRRKTTLYKGIYVDGKAEDVKLKFTADTGATVTILSERVFEQIPAEKRPQLNGSNMLKDVSGYPVTEHGTAKVHLELGSLKLTQTVVVADIEDDALLGDDVMIEHPDGPADLILSQRKIVTGGCEIPCQIVGKIARRAVAADHYIIPGHSEVLVDVYVEESGGDSRSVQEGSQAMEEVSHVRCEDTPVTESDYSVEEIGTVTRPLIESDDQGADLSGDLGNGPQRTSRVKEGVAMINDEALECPWASPLMFVEKPDGTLRPVIDFRALNGVTCRDAFPIPRIQDCLDAVSGATLFSTLDLTSGYHQVPVREEDIPKTAFICKYGLFESPVIPFGVTGAPALFQHVMELAMSGLQWSTVLIYLDDLVIWGRDFQEHLSKLRLVLDRIKAANLKLKPQKCHLCKPSVEFLGHIVCGKGISPNAMNVAKVQQWPVPRTVKEVKQFLGLANYYRRFIPQFSKVANPLTNLTRKETSFNWDLDCQEAFEKLKLALTGSPIVAYPQDTGLYVLDTDACGVAIGAVLSQIQDGQERVIAYASRSLNKSEKNYCITDKELLAVRYYLEYFRQYLLGRKIKVRTDHRALRWLFTFKEPKGRVAAWLEVMTEYDFQIEYRPGSWHCNSDALSRYPNEIDCSCEEGDTTLALRCGPCAKCLKKAREMQGDLTGMPFEPGGSEHDPDVSESHGEMAIRAIRQTTAINTPAEVMAPVLGQYSVPEIARLQRQDKHLRPLIKWVESFTTASPITRHYWNYWANLEIHDGVLFKKFYKKFEETYYYQLLVPTIMKNHI